jgi:hypothetical protein
MSSELNLIFMECKKTGNFDKFIKYKKEFIDNEIIKSSDFWYVQKYLTISDIDYFYNSIKDDVCKVIEYINIFIDYKFLPIELIEKYYDDIIENRNIEVENINKYFIEMTNKNANNVKYFVLYLQNNNRFKLQKKIIEHIRCLRDKETCSEILKKIQKLNDNIDTKYLLEIVNNYNDKQNYKINLRNFLGFTKFLEYLVDYNKIHDIYTCKQEEINYILFYKLNKLEMRTNKLIKQISKILKIDLDAEIDED